MRRTGVSRLGPFFFCFFFLFFVIFLFLFIFEPPSYTFYDFFLILGGRGVFLEGVQKYFVKVEMMWSNFKKTRDAWTRRSVLGGTDKTNPKKLPKKTERITFWGPKNHPRKVSSATWAGIFRPPPVECLRSENLLTLILCNSAQALQAK